MSRAFYCRAFLLTGKEEDNILRGRGHREGSSLSIKRSDVLHDTTLTRSDDVNLQAVQHSWTYKPLVHDIFSMDLNRFTVEEPATLPGAAPSKKSFEVGDDDFFWEANGRAPFPQVAAESDKELSRYKQVISVLIGCAIWERSCLCLPIGPLSRSIQGRLLLRAHSRTHRTSTV